MIVIRNVSGTPSAVPLAEPNDDVMSLRTTPVSVRALTPLLPSPGNGPAVSSGTALGPLAPFVVVGPPPDPPVGGRPGPPPPRSTGAVVLVDGAVGDDPVDVGAASSSPHAARSAAAPAPSAVP